MTRIGRQLSIGKTDNTSDQRTPRKRLRLIPTDVRESFVPVIPARAVQRQNEWDLTRIAPNRPRAEGSPIEVKGTVRNESGTLLRGALIEIWNANHYGRYRHVEDHSGLKLDENFFGIGRGGAVGVEPGAGRYLMTIAGRDLHISHGHRSGGHIKDQGRAARPRPGEGKGVCAI